MTLLANITALLADPDPARTAVRRAALARPVFFIVGGGFGSFVGFIWGLETFFDVEDPIFSLTIMATFGVMLLTAPWPKLWPAIGQLLCLISTLGSCLAFVQFDDVVLPTLVMNMVYSYFVFKRSVSLLFSGVYMAVLIVLAAYSDSPEAFSAMLGTVSIIWACWWVLDTLVVRTSPHEPRAVELRLPLLMIILSLLIMILLGLLGIDDAQQAKLNGIKVVLLTGLLAACWQRPIMLRRMLNVVALLVIVLMLAGTAQLERLASYFSVTIILFFLLNTSTRALILSSGSLVAFFALHNEWIIDTGFAIAWRVIATNIGLIGVCWFLVERLRLEEQKASEQPGLAAMFFTPLHVWRAQWWQFFRDIFTVCGVVLVIVLGFLSAHSADNAAVESPPISEKRLAELEGDLNVLSMLLEDSNLDQIIDADHLAQTLSSTIQWLPEVVSVHRLSATTLWQLTGTSTDPWQRIGVVDTATLDLLQALASTSNTWWLSPLGLPLIDTSDREVVQYSIALRWQDQWLVLGIAEDDISFNVGPGIDMLTDGVVVPLDESLTETSLSRWLKRAEVQVNDTPIGLPATESRRLWWLWSFAIVLAVLMAIFLRAQIVRRTVLLSRSVLDSEMYKQRAEFANRRAQQANKIRAQFIDNTSREMRSPLNSIFGAVELLKNAADISANASALSVLQQSAQRLLQMVVALLDMSRLLTMASQQVMGNHPLFALLQPLQQKYADFSASQGVTFMPIAKIDADLMVYTDANELSKVLDILLAEVVNGSQEGLVYFSFKVREPFVELTLVAHAFELPDGLLQAINSVNVDIATLTNTEAVGMVLCRRVMSDLQGALHVQHVAGSGTVFKLQIPMTVDVLSEVATP